MLNPIIYYVYDCISTSLNSVLPFHTIHIINPFKNTDLSDLLHVLREKKAIHDVRSADFMSLRNLISQLKIMREAHLSQYLNSVYLIQEIFKRETFSLSLVSDTSLPPLQREYALYELRNVWELRKFFATCSSLELYGKVVELQMTKAYILLHPGLHHQYFYIHSCFPYLKINCTDLWHIYHPPKWIPDDTLVKQLLTRQFYHDCSVNMINWLYIDKPELPPTKEVADYIHNRIHSDFNNPINSRILDQRIHEMVERNIEQAQQTHNLSLRASQNYITNHIMPDLYVKAHVNVTLDRHLR